MSCWVTTHYGIILFQHLPAHLANQLQVPEKNSYCVPTHLHLHQVTLKKSSSESVILKALPPPHFLWTLKRLHLISDTETIQREEYMVG